MAPEYEEVYWHEHSMSPLRPGIFPSHLEFVVVATAVVFAVVLLVLHVEIISVRIHTGNDCEDPQVPETPQRPNPRERRVAGGKLWHRS